MAIVKCDIVAISAYGLQTVEVPFCDEEYSSSSSSSTSAEFSSSSSSTSSESESDCPQDICNPYAGALFSIVGTPSEIPFPVPPVEGDSCYYIHISDNVSGGNEVFGPFPTQSSAVAALSSITLQTTQASTCLGTSSDGYEVLDPNYYGVGYTGTPSLGSTFYSISALKVYQHSISSLLYQYWYISR